MKEENKSITVKKVCIDKDGKKRIVKREIPEVIPGEFDEEDDIIAEIMMDVFFSNK